MPPSRPGSWWDTYPNQRVDTDKLLDLAKEKRLLAELRTGRTDHGSRVALGMMLAANRDRVIGLNRIRQVGTNHGGETWLLEIYAKAEIAHGKDSLDSPVSPQSQLGDGESSDTVESFSDPNSINSENPSGLCDSCGASARGLGATYLSDGGILCPDCGRS